jgi:hypothetical protein
MRILSYVFLRFLLPLPLACSACVITIGPYDETGETSPPALPDPSEGGGGPSLDEAQQARKDRPTGTPPR